MYDWENLLCNQHPACNIVSANEARWKRTGRLTSPEKPTFQPGLQCSLLRRASAGSSTPVTFLIISHRPGITWPIATSLQVMTVTFLWGHTREQQEGRHAGGVATVKPQGWPKKMSDQMAPSSPLHPFPTPSPRTSQFRICIPSSAFFAGRCCHGFRTSSLSETGAISCACLSPQGKSELRGITSQLRNATGICASRENKGPNQRSTTPDSLKLQRHKKPSQVSYPAKAVLTEDDPVSVCKLDPTARCN